MVNLASTLKPPSFSKLRAFSQAPLYRNAYALMFSTAASSGLGLVYWVLAARYYSTEAMGLNSAIVSVMIFVSGISQLNLMSALVRFLPRAGRASLRLVGFSYLISIVLSVLLGLVSILGLSTWSPELQTLQLSPTFVAWFVISTVAWSIFALQDNVLAGLRQAVWVPLENISYAVAKIVLLLLFATAFQEFGIFASWTIPLILTLIPINILIFRRLLPKHVADTQAQAVPLVPREIAQFVTVNYVGSLFVLASNRLVPVIVASIAGVSSAAYFYLPWTMATAIKLVSTNMTTSLTVEGATDQSQLNTYCIRILTHITRLLVPMIALLVLAAPYILRISGSDYASEGTMLLRLLALSALPSAVNALYISVARVRTSMTGIATVQGGYCLLVLGLSYFWLPRYGITGVGMAVLCSETIVAITLMCTQLRPIFGELIGRTRQYFS